MGTARKIRNHRRHTQAGAYGKRQGDRGSSSSHSAGFPPSTPSFKQRQDSNTKWKIMCMISVGRACGPVVDGSGETFRAMLGVGIEVCCNRWDEEIMRVEKAAVALGGFAPAESARFMSQESTSGCHGGHLLTEPRHMMTELTIEDLVDGLEQWTSARSSRVTAYIRKLFDSLVTGNNLRYPNWAESRGSPAANIHRTRDAFLDSQRF